MKKTMFLIAVLLLLFVAGCTPEKAVDNNKNTKPQSSYGQEAENSDSVLSEALDSTQSATESKKEDFGSDSKTETPDVSPSPDNSETDIIINSSAPEKISKEDAKKIALKDAGLTQADIRDFEIELDIEAGVLTYEISFKNKNIEYDYDI